MRYILFVIPDLKQKDKELKLDSENCCHQRVKNNLMILRSVSMLRTGNCIATTLKYKVQGDTGDAGSILGSGRSSGRGNGNSLQYCCLENPVDRGAWWVPVHTVTKSQTLLSTHAHSFI